jgi:heat-inducible transcriptional repressor
VAVKLLQMAPGELRLTNRQRQVMRHVVEEYVATRRPVGSKGLVERGGLRVSASTVRAELARLERMGLLTHPHTSAGRVPTEAGYRLYAASALADLEPRPDDLGLDLRALRTEVETALRATTKMLSEMTRLLALVSAPPLEAATVRHVEVLLLQPNVLMVVVITSSGGVIKRIFTAGEPIDAGLAAWAAEYLNDQVAGVQLGSHSLRQRLLDPSLSARERGFLEVLRPAFTQATGDEQQLFIGGAAGLLGGARAEELEACHRVLQLLEQRAAVLRLLDETLASAGPFVRMGEDLEHPALRDVALVGAAYGLRTRRLGSVSLLGPLRMDYDKAIRSVQSAAFELSRFVEEVYEEN